jgi:hypothetical protein
MSDHRPESSTQEEYRRRKAQNQMDYLARKRARTGKIRLRNSFTDDIEGIGKFKALWEKLHDMHPSKTIGWQILEHLSAAKALTHKVQPQTLELDSVPTGADLLEDVKSHTKFFNHLTGESNAKFDWYQFMRGWEAMRDYANPLMEHYTPFVAFDVVSHPGKGLSRCIQKIPAIIERNAVCARRHENGTPMLYGVFTPAGTITSPHCDTTGSGHIILLVYGVKLVLWWDCNTEVMEDFSLMHCLTKGNLSVNAVKTWPGLNWAILDKPGQYLVMRPGQIHAVVSPLNSAVSGWSFVLPDWLEDGTLRNMMSWEMGVIEKRLEEPSIGCNSPFIGGGPVETMGSDLELWTLWLESGVLNDELGSKLNSLLGEMTERLEKIKREKNTKKKSKSR